MASSIDVADKTTLDAAYTLLQTVNGTKIGATDDSGATASTGSVNGKLNKIITDASTNMGYVMAGESPTVTISTASFTSVAQGTKIQKIGSFTPAHTGVFDVTAKVQTLSNNSSSYKVYVSTTSANNPTEATLESTKKGVSNVIESKDCRLPFLQVIGCQITANQTYYIHIVCVDTGSTVGTVTINELFASGTYATSTPCQTVIKSIQHGKWETGQANIPIQPVAPAKCVVLLTDMAAASYNRTYILLPEMLKLYYRTTSSDNQNVGSCTWTIIEFY